MQVTKLCDLGMDDGVCSVGWAQRGTHLAVGTTLGKVQVRHYQKKIKVACINAPFLLNFSYLINSIFGTISLLPYFIVILITFLVRKYMPALHRKISMARSPFFHDVSEYAPFSSP